MSPRRRRRAGRRPTKSLVLERLLVAAGQQAGDIHPPCHPKANLKVMLERGGLLHLHCAECSRYALTVELR